MKIICLLLLPLFLFSACAPKEKKNSSWVEENGKVKVLSTIAMINDLVKEIGGDHVDTLTLIVGDLDPHTYELVKGDDEKFERADVVFYNGIGLEHGLSLAQLLQSHPHAHALGEKIDPSFILKMDNQLDPHIWMDISLWKEFVDPIVAILSEKDPAHHAEFYDRGERLKEKMGKKDQAVYLLLQSIPKEKRYLVTSHNAFHYFTRRYLATPEELASDSWKVRSQAPEGLAPEAQLGFLDLQFIVDHVARFQIPVLFLESNVNKDALDKIIAVCKEKGIDIRLSKGTLYADAMGDEKSYLDMIEHNVNLILAELKN